MKKLTKILLLVLVAALLSVSVLAATGVVDAKLTYRDIKLVLDGREITPTDAAGKSTEPFILNDSTYLPVRAIAEALGLDVKWDDETSTVSIVSDGIRADEVIKDVHAIGFVDADGAKLRAIAVEYDAVLKAESVSVDDFVVADYGTLASPKCELGENPGAVTRVYVNDKPETAGTGKTEGKYVIIEVNTDYQLASVAKKYAAALAAGVKQVGSVESDKGLIVPAVEMVKNYDHVVIEGKKPNGQPKRDEYDLAREGTYTIEGIEGYELHSVALGNAFHATNCFDEADGKLHDFDLAYALYVPEDYDPKGNYGLVLHIEDAGFLGTDEATCDPMIVLTEGQAPANFASAEVQAMAKKNGMDGLIVVCPQFYEAIRTTRDNWSISCGVAGTWQLLDSLTEKYSIDENRIYGTGQSMGGMQVVAMAAQRDNYFAGIWLPGCQWGSCYNLEVPYSSFNSPAARYYSSADATIWRTDADGNSTVETNSAGEKVVARNWYYLVSDDNILVTSCAGDAFASTVWQEFWYLVKDMGGTEFPIASVKPLEDSVDEMNAAMRKLTATENDTGFYWMLQDGGSHMLTWVYAHKMDAGYEWLLSQKREDEMARGKIAQMANPWKAADAETAAAVNAADPNREIGRLYGTPSGEYFAVPAAGAGTAGYNSGWYNRGAPMEGKLPGWTA